MSDTLSGMHHVSALSNDIGASHRFYTGTLGLRTLIKTVNQDEPGMYHLFYGDGEGSPGSDMTVFDLPHATPERRGNNSITRTTFRVEGHGSLEKWCARLDARGIANSGIIERDGRNVVDFDDTVGTQLSLVDDRGAGASCPWSESAIPEKEQIRGLGYVMITIPELEPTDRFLTLALGLEEDHSYPLERPPDTRVHVYRMPSAGEPDDGAPRGAGAPQEAGQPGAAEGSVTPVERQLHVVVRPDLAPARYGSGGVHHFALRVPDQASDPNPASLARWAEHLDTLGYPNSGIVDRHYFRSLYVREPGGILFELATDGPGFEVDGPIDGEKLTLPPSLEGQRERIESVLRPIETQ